MPTHFTKLNVDWNAQPNAPVPRVFVADARRLRRACSVGPARITECGTRKIRAELSPERLIALRVASRNEHRSCSRCIAMGFFRAKEQAHRSVEWSRFKHRAAQLLERAELPAYLCDSNSAFQDFLTHGYLDHRAQPYRFNVRDLDDAQRSALRELVVSYLAAGFGDPGLGLFGAAEHDAIRAEAAGRRRL